MTETEICELTREMRSNLWSVEILECNGAACDQCWRLARTFEQIKAEGKMMPETIATLLLQALEQQTKTLRKVML